MSFVQPSELAGRTGEVALAGKVEDPGAEHVDAGGEVRHDALRLALTGTPVLNRAEELVALADAVNAKGRAISV